jgi:hypothetical protein
MAALRIKKATLGFFLNSLILWNRRKSLIVIIVVISLVRSAW